MNRFVLAATGVITGVGIAACGSAAASGPTAAPSSPSGRAGFARNGAFGQLVQINGQTLILSGTNGDSTVTYAPTTTITQTRTGTLADITAGSCISATGTKDASGVVTASTVILSAPVKGACTGFGGVRAGAGTFSPRPGFSPPAVPAGFTAARGQVRSVTGTSVTLTEKTGTTTTTATIDVPTTVKVTTSSVVTAAALQTGECLTAVGSKNTSGTVVARSLTITPPGLNGCTAGFGGGGFRGGFGGGFGAGGFGGGGGGTTGG